MKVTALGFWAVSTAGETTCFLVEDGDILMLLDVGLNPGLQLTEVGQRLTSVTHCFISHSHADHLQGFANFVFTRDTQQRLYGDAPPLVVIGGATEVENCRTLLHVFYPERELKVDWHVASSGDSVALGSGREAMPFRTEHTVPSQGVVLNLTGGKRVVFTGDTTPFAELAGHCQDANLLIGECFGTAEDFGELAGRLKHMTAEQIAALANEAQPSKLILFHMQAKYAAEAPREALLDVVRRTFSGEVIFPRRLESVDVS